MQCQLQATFDYNLGFSGNLANCQVTFEYKIGKRSDLNHKALSTERVNHKLDSFLYAI